MAINKITLPGGASHNVEDSRVLSEDIAYVGTDDGTASIVDFDAQTDTVWNKAQVLTAAQQLAARTNIGVPTFVHLTSESEMPATPDSNTIYFIDVTTI